MCLDIGGVMLRAEKTWSKETEFNLEIKIDRRTTFYERYRQKTQTKLRKTQVCQHIQSPINFRIDSIFVASLL